MTGSELPGLMGNWTDEELNQHTILHAKYFTVVQIQRGGFVSGGSNYVREQVDTLANARKRAAEIYEIQKKPILIYAVADFAGANGFSRPVENYPPVTYQTRADKARSEKLAKQKAKEMARAARLSLGEKHSRTSEGNIPDKEFMDADEPMVMITTDD